MKNRGPRTFPRAVMILLLLLAIPAFPVLAGGQLHEVLDLSAGTPFSFMAGDYLPPTLQPTSILDYPPAEASRPPSYKAPLQLRPEDHFWFDRPIPSNAVNWIDSSYRYGGDYSDDMVYHSGADFPAKTDTPVLAVADGVVNWAGYGLFNHTYSTLDPYGKAVSIRHDFGYLGQPLYTAYGHLKRIDVKAGQRVIAGQQIGIVGMTGKASGPHLHFEVRVGEDDYYHTRNPELWIVPPQGYGVLAGRIETSDQWPLPVYSFLLKRLETGKSLTLLTYGGNVTHFDDLYRENFVASDLPAGTYLIDTWVWWRHYSFTVNIEPGMTTYVVIRSGSQPMINPPVSLP